MQRMIIALTLLLALVGLVLVSRGGGSPISLTPAHADTCVVDQHTGTVYCTTATVAPLPPGCMYTHEGIQCFPVGTPSGCRVDYVTRTIVCPPGG
jgi:hypothetical protein